MGTQLPPDNRSYHYNGDMASVREFTYQILSSRLSKGNCFENEFYIA
ncbi:hypothetical protein CFP56_025125 [Quercus suber]|uniref:Uncharacterized protein n=1 Tax=Quercus suber TaxID=58331 RepID=A0AAW0K5W8_QUESU